MSEFEVQGANVCVHPCRNGWAPGKESRHRRRGPCPGYGERAGLWMVAIAWQRPVCGDGRHLPRFDNSMVLPLERP